MHGFYRAPVFFHMVASGCAGCLFFAKRVFYAVLATDLEGVVCVVRVRSVEGVRRARCVLSTVGDGGYMAWRGASHILLS